VNRTVDRILFDSVQLRGYLLIRWSPKNLLLSWSGRVENFTGGSTLNPPAIPTLATNYWLIYRLLRINGKWNSVAVRWGPINRYTVYLVFLLMHVLIRAHFVCFVTLCTRNLHLTQFTVYFFIFWNERWYACISLGVWDRGLMTRLVSDRPRSWSWSYTFGLGLGLGLTILVLVLVLVLQLWSWS